MDSKLTEAMKRKIVVWEFLFCSLEFYDLVWWHTIKVRKEAKELAALFPGYLKIHSGVYNVGCS